jgi:hypothetical protein
MLGGGTRGGVVRRRMLLVSSTLLFLQAFEGVSVVYCWVGVSISLTLRFFNMGWRREEVLTGR